MFIQVSRLFLAALCSSGFRDALSPINCPLPTRHRRWLASAALEACT
jgi:hypothetical protein